MSLLVPFYGYCEVDTMISRQSALLLAVAFERYSQHPHIASLPTKSARELRIALNRRLGQHPKHLPKSIIYDNGSEDVEHMLINKILSTH